MKSVTATAVTPASRRPSSTRSSHPERNGEKSLLNSQRPWNSQIIWYA